MMDQRPRSCVAIDFSSQTNSASGLRPQGDRTSFWLIKDRADCKLTFQDSSTIAMNISYRRSNLCVRVRFDGLFQEVDQTPFSLQG
jgi:hypothetical protein